MFAQKACLVGTNKCSISAPGSKKIQFSPQHVIPLHTHASVRWKLLQKPPLSSHSYILCRYPAAASNERNYAPIASTAAEERCNSGKYWQCGSLDLESSPGALCRYSSITEGFHGEDGILRRSRSY
jgi:hypothetical protein